MNSNVNETVNTKNDETETTQRDLIRVAIEQCRLAEAKWKKAQTVAEFGPRVLEHYREEYMSAQMRLGSLWRICDGVLGTDKSIHARSISVTELPLTYWPELCSTDFLAIRHDGKGRRTSIDRLEPHEALWEVAGFLMGKDHRYYVDTDTHAPVADRRNPASHLAAWQKQLAAVADSSR